MILHVVPKKRRVEMDMRWTTGVFLGTTMGSNEPYIGLSNGSVVRGRALNRVRPDQRWSQDTIQKLRRTPGDPMCKDDTEVESLSDPHVNADDEERDARENEDEAKDMRLNAKR